MAETDSFDTTLLDIDQDDNTENARRILQAGLELFAEQGYAATSVREIVRAADVTNPMLYYYFDNKEGLFLALIEYFFNRISKRIGNAAEDSEDFDNFVEGLIWAHMEGCLENPGALQFVYYVLFGPPESQPSFDAMEARDPMIRQVHQRFEQARQSGEVDLPEPYTVETAIERLFGLVNQQLMHALKQSESSVGEARRDIMEEFLNRETCRELKHFYFRGLGIE